MTDRYEVRISGTGGQGVVLAGIILAEAAGCYHPGRYIAQTVHYGPEVRGGLSSAEIVISDEPIDYPLPLRLDLLIPMTQGAAAEGARLMKPKGLIIHDPELVLRPPPGWIAPLPLTRLAVEATGRALMANIVALGAASALSPVLETEALKAALKARASERLKDSFWAAAEAGRQAALKAKEQIRFEELPSADD